MPLTIAAVRQAIDECDRLGRDAFLERYGFARAKDYVLVVDGKDYDSKAIAAVANKWAPGGRRALTTQDNISGGNADVATKLKKLGFVVERRTARIDWTWDEHVLALELYMVNPASPPSKSSAQVVALSELLNRLGERRGMNRSETYRNANGVYMKMMNFRRFDQAFQVAGKSGLRRGNELEKEVWDEFAVNRGALAQAAQAIRTAINDGTVTIASVDEDLEAEEGGLILRLHLSRERSRKLIQKKRKQVHAQLGHLACEVCDFEFTERYGDLGHGFIEVHHRKPVASLSPGDKTRLEDLALVCANCHRMLHRRSALLSVEDLRAIVDQQRRRFAADAA